MKIIYLADKPDVRRGSYRIWVHDSIASLTAIGQDCSLHGINALPRLVYDVDHAVIVDKADLHQIPKRLSRRCLLGAINPPAELGDRFDFAIVGSVEEKIALSGNFARILISPLIERTFADYCPPERTERSEIKIGYHGNSLHLSAMAASGLTSAIEDFAATLSASGRQLSLEVVTENAKPRWRHGRPDVPVQFHAYDPDMIRNVISRCDIGVVPNAHAGHVGRLSSYLMRKVLQMDVHSSDYALRFKSKSNFGRALVFMQLGVPVVADLTPSHLALIEDAETGHLAFSRASWLSAFNLLANRAHNDRISRAARNLVDRRYPQDLNSRKLVEFLVRLRADTPMDSS